MKRGYKGLLALFLLLLCTTVLSISAAAYDTSDLKIPSNATAYVYGQSGAGRDLTAYRFGKGKNVMVLGFAMHGYEGNFQKDGGALVYSAGQLMNYLSDNMATVNNYDWTIYVLPCMNPDGLIDGYSSSGPGRLTTTYFESDGRLLSTWGIDLNRTFPSNWKPELEDLHYFTAYKPLASKEAVALSEFLQSVKGSGANLLYDIHGWAGKIMASSNNGLCQVLKASFPSNTYVSSRSGNGYFINYAASLGYTSCFFEFPGDVHSLSAFQKSSYPRKFNQCILDTARIFGNYSKTEATVTAKAEGSGTVTGGGTYYIGDKVTLTAAPQNGAKFLGWFDRTGAKLSSELTYSWTLAGSTTVTAKFGVSITAVGSSLGTVTGSGNYTSGASVTLTATPNSGCRFEGWYDGDGNLLSAEASYSFTAQNTLIAYARFVDSANAITVTVLTEGNGTVTGGGTYSKGATVTLTAHPNSGYVFLGWVDSAGHNFSNESTFRWTVSGNTTVTAQFGVTLTVIGSSTGTVTGSGSYLVGSNITLNATPAEGYSFTGWYSTNGTLISSEAVFPCKVNQSGTIVGMFSGDPFLDVKPGAWYCADVAESVKRNLITGINAITFQPDGALTRAQVVVILARMAQGGGIDTSGAPACAFTDVAQGSWYSAEVNWAYSKGIVNGITSTTFGPGQSVTRQDFTVMIQRYLKNVLNLTPASAALTFRDSAAIASYAREAVGQAVEMGLINGYQESDGTYTFRPKNTLLRKEGVKMLVSLSKYLEKDDPKEDPTPETETLTDAVYGLKLTVDPSDAKDIAVNPDKENNIIFSYRDPKTVESLGDKNSGLVWSIRVQDRKAYESNENIGMGDNGWPLWNAGVTHCILARDDQYYYQLIFLEASPGAYDSASYPACQEKSLSWLTGFVKDNGLTVSPTLTADYEKFCQWVLSLAPQDKEE